MTIGRFEFFRLSRALAACLMVGIAMPLSIATGAEKSIPLLTAFVGATVIDGTGAAPVTDATVLVRDERIVAVGPRHTIAVLNADRVVDLTGKWIIPGLVDAHVHFFQSAGLYARPDVVDLRTIRAYEGEIARTRARPPQTLARYIASGVTSMVDVGGPMWNFEIRDLASKRDVAPRVAVAGPLLATAAPPQLAVSDAPIIRITTPGQARSEVRRQLARSPDLKKIWFVYPGEELESELRWIRAAISEAHAAGVRVTAHATQLRFARAMLELGVDVLVHSIVDRFLDEATLDALKARSVPYVTTLVVWEGYREVLGQQLSLSRIERRLGDPEAIASYRLVRTVARHRLPAWIRSGADTSSIEHVQAVNLARAVANGVIVAAGSDAGNIGTLHGPALHRELELMAAAPGVSTMDVLVAATRGGAVVMGRARELGTIEPGKLGDMVILDRDPLADIRNTRHIHRVVKGGAIFDPTEVMAMVLDDNPQP